MLGTTVMIVISSDRVVKDLLEKRSGIYSSRPDMYIMRALSGGDTRVTFMPYGEEWRLVRKIYHNTLNVKDSSSYVPYQDLESTQLLAGLLEAPGLYEDHIKRFMHSQTTQIVFGYRITSIDDPNLKQFFRSFEAVMVAALGTNETILDIFPLLRRLPDCCLPMKRHAARLHKAEEKLYGGHWLRAKAKVENGTSKVCINNRSEQLFFHDPWILHIKYGLGMLTQAPALFLQGPLQRPARVPLLRQASSLHRRRPARGRHRHLCRAAPGLRPGHGPVPGCAEDRAGRARPRLRD